MITPFIILLVSIFFVCFITTALLTRYVIVLCVRNGLVDYPDKDRRSHKKATPRGGGVAIYVIFLLGFMCIDYLLHNFNYSPKLIPILTLAAGVSFLEDIRGLNILLRLLAHLIVSALAIYYFLSPIPLFHGELPYFLDLLVAIIGLAGFMNIYNFLDGIDGITVMQTVHLSLTIMILCYLKSEVIYQASFIAVIAFILLACILGFMVYNWPPAKIFLGDVGSISLGLLLGLCLILIAASGERLFCSVVIATLYYIADGGLTILIRLSRGEAIWLPHLNHFFQQAIKKGMTHKQVTLKVAFCNILLLLLAVNALTYPVISSIIAIIIVGIVLIHFSK